MNLDLSTAADEWIAAKEAERAAVERRRVIEDHLASLIGIAENMEGTETVETDDGHKIKITGRMSRKVDAELLQEVARENGLSDHLQSLFRWKPEINMAAWKSANKEITTPLLKAVTTAPSRASFTITKGE